MQNIPRCRYKSIEDWSTVACMALSEEQFFYDYINILCLIWMLIAKHGEYGIWI